MRILQLVRLRLWLPEQSFQEAPAWQWSQQMSLVWFDLFG